MLLYLQIEGVKISAILQALNLSDNKITNDGVAIVIRGINVNTSLKAFAISDNPADTELILQAENIIENRNKHRIALQNKDDNSSVSSGAQATSLVSALTSPSGIGAYGRKIPTRLLLSRRFSSSVESSISEELNFEQDDESASSHPFKTTLPHSLLSISRSNSLLSTERDNNSDSCSEESTTDYDRDEKQIKKLKKKNNHDKVFIPPVGADIQLPAPEKIKRIPDKNRGKPLPKPLREHTVEVEEYIKKSCELGRTRGVSTNKFIY